MSPYTPKYLPFDRHHVDARIDGLFSESLSEAARRVKDTGAVSHASALNHIVRTLGFKSPPDMEERLAAVMSEHRLTTLRDLLAPSTWQPLLRLTHRQVADRLFASGRPAPRRIFTGVDVDWHAFLAAAEGLDDLKVSSMEAMDEFGHPAMFPFDDVREVAVDDLWIPLVDGSGQRIGRSVEDNVFCFVAGREGTLMLREASVFANLIGDQLCDLGEGFDVDPVAQLYEQGRPVPAETQEMLAGAGRTLHAVISACPQGWAEVVPCSDGLFLLKDAAGGYDFVFRNMRSKPFGTDGDRASEDGEERFARWLHFNYAGWLERDRHVAESAFYAGGGTRAEYNEDAILREHLTREGAYVQKRRKAAPAPEKGFTTLACGDRILCFSDLVTVAQFRRFMEEDYTYRRRRARRRGLDPWEPVNGPEDSFLPASVTQEDAKAYARWFAKVNRLPVRLATEEEFLGLAEGIVPEGITPGELAEAARVRLCDFVDPSGRRHEGHPDYMEPAEFDRWGLRYIASACDWKVSAKGLKVLASYHFAEWLQPRAAAVNTLFFCSQPNIGMAPHVRVSASAGPFTSTSTGKYKCWKIGFRLVYEGA